MSISDELFERGRAVMPGGVNSPVRAFGAVGRNPVFIKRAYGSKIYDEEGREYIDYVNSWGPMILGHWDERIISSVNAAVENGLSFGAPTEIEVEMAELICEVVPNVDMIRMVNSGTEAVMSALRLARGYTGKDKIIKFEGCYHGHCDSMLVKAGSGALTQGEPSSAGVPRGIAEYTLTAEYNNIESVEMLFNENKDEIAAVIVEPVAANMGVVMPNEGFLKGLRVLCDKNKSLLIFDEVITGFRLGIGGAQDYFNVKADIVTFGKIIGGGMPVGAYCARKEIMSCVSPCGGVYQAGTLSGNPVAMAAGLTQLKILVQNPEIYDEIDKKAAFIAENMRNMAKKYNKKISVNQIGSLICAFMTEDNVSSYKAAVKSNTNSYKKYFNLMFEGGIYIAPSQFEAMFVSSKHSDEDIEKTISAFENAVKEL